MRKNIKYVMTIVLVMFVLMIFPNRVFAEELSDSTEVISLDSGTYTVASGEVTINRVQVNGDVVFSGSGTLNCRIQVNEGGSLTIENGFTLNCGNAMGMYGNIINQGTVNGAIAGMRGENRSLTNNGIINGTVNCFEGTVFENTGRIIGSNDDSSVYARGVFINSGTIDVDYFGIGGIEPGYPASDAVNNEGGVIRCRECNGNDGVLKNYGSFYTEIYGGGLRVIGNEPIGVIEDRHPAVQEPSEISTNEDGDENETENDDDESNDNNESQNNEEPENSVGVLENSNSDIIENDAKNESITIYDISLAVTPKTFSTAMKKIDKNTPKGQTEYLFSVWPITFNKSMLQELNNRNNTVVYYFWHLGHFYSVTIPAKTNVSHIIKNNNEFAGPLYIGKVLGTSKLIK